MQGDSLRYALVIIGVVNIWAAFHYAWAARTLRTICRRPKSRVTVGSRPDQMLTLTDDEKAMLDGRRGKATQKAMDLLVRYAEALGAERFVDTKNVAGVPGRPTRSCRTHSRTRAARRATPSSRSSTSTPTSSSRRRRPSCTPAICRAARTRCTGRRWRARGGRARHEAREAFAVSKGGRDLKTCTPYLARQRARLRRASRVDGVVGRHLRQLVLGARTNTEGRESTSAPCSPGKIPDWGLHRDEPRRGTHRVDVRLPIESVIDWGMLGYFTGDVVQEHIPVLVGGMRPPDIVRLKHFGAAGVVVGRRWRCITWPASRPRRRTRRPRSAGNVPGGLRVRRGRAQAGVRRAQRRRQRSGGGLRDARLPARGARAAARGGRAPGRPQISGNTRLWIFTSRAVRTEADAAGYTNAIAAAGGVVMTDTCSAFAQALPPGTKVAALDSAKQAHLPAGDSRPCRRGSAPRATASRRPITGRWNGSCPS
jgi:hypothetical protein